MESQPFVLSQLLQQQLQHQRSPSSTLVPVLPLDAAPPLPPPPPVLAATSGGSYPQLHHEATDDDMGESQYDEGGAKVNFNGSAKQSKAGKKQRYAFQTRSKVDVLDDGYRWRKYGQKAVKNTKFPRSYYRCTHPGCGVKKQVQRLSRDEEVVVTTYDGVHNHPIQRPNDSFDHILREMQIYDGCMPKKDQLTHL